MVRKVLWLPLLISVITVSPGMSGNAMADQKTVIGWLEAVYLPVYDFLITAKIDTGAKNSSIHATDVEYVQRGKGGSGRIRFKTTDLRGRSQIIETEVLKQVTIKKSSIIRRTRPEIELEICLGGVRKRIRVNLCDRGGMNYRMILGRTALEGDFTVDVSEKYIAEPRCGKNETR